MPTLPQSEIKAIAKLLKTHDESTSKLLEEQFKTFDIELLKKIDNEIPLDDKELKERFLKLVFNVKSESLKKDFLSWTKSSSSDLLEEGVFLIALFNNPLLNAGYYLSMLDNWAEILGNNLKKIKVKNDPTSIINETNHFFFMELGFKGNKKNYYDPSNSFIDKVIDTKLGNPILLSVIYLLVTRKLGLPFSGVNMPAHFLIQYYDTVDPIYIDPFSQGEIITRTICEERIKALKLSWQNEYLSAPTGKQIVTRIMQNLINIYHSDGMFDLKEILEDYVNILKRN